MQNSRLHHVMPGPFKRTCTRKERQKDRDSLRRDRETERQATERQGDGERDKDQMCTFANVYVDNVCSYGIHVYICGAQRKHG